MATFPWLTTLALLPLVGAVMCLFLQRDTEWAKRTALGVSLVVLGLTVALAFQYDPQGPAFQFVERHDWIPAFGVQYALGVDGIALVLLALSAVLVPVVILAGWNDTEGPDRVGPGKPAARYFALLLVLETFMVYVFTATDLFLFYVAFEAMLIPVYFLIGGWGRGPNRTYAAVKFLLYSLFGGLLMLASVIGLYVVAARQQGVGTFDWSTLVGLDIDPTTQRWLFLGFFIAFAIKAPLWPVHTWLPDAAASSTPATAVLLVGVLDKIGTYGMIRWLLPVLPDATRWYAPVVLAIAVIGILYGALAAIGQADMMRLVAYTSLSHFGFITLGIFALTTQGLSGSTFYMFNHGLSTGGLFLVVGFLLSRRGSKLINDYGGVQRVAPVLAGVFLFMGLATLALPGLSTFVSEFLTLVGTFTRYPWLAAVATVGIILAAIYVLYWYKRVAQGPATDNVEGFRDLGLREVLAVAPLIVLLVGLGFFPRAMLDVINPSVDRTLQTVGVTDPVPPHPVNPSTTLEGTAP